MEITNSDTDAAAAEPDATGARNMLANLCREGFDGDVDKTALVLGRESEYVQQALDGESEIDEDLVMKMRGIAEERGLVVE